MTRSAITNIITARVLLLVLLSAPGAMVGCGPLDSAESEDATPTFFGGTPVAEEVVGQPVGLAELRRERLDVECVVDQHCRSATAKKEGSGRERLYCVPGDQNDKGWLLGRCVAANSLPPGSACTEYGTGLHADSNRLLPPNRNDVNVCSPGSLCVAVPGVAYWMSDHTDDDYAGISRGRHEMHAYRECVASNGAEELPQWTEVGGLTSDGKAAAVKVVASPPRTLCTGLKAWSSTSVESEFRRVAEGAPGTWSEMRPAGYPAQSSACDSLTPWCSATYGVTGLFRIDFERAIEQDKVHLRFNRENPAAKSAFGDFVEGATRAFGLVACTNLAASPQSVTTRPAR